MSKTEAEQEYLFPAQDQDKDLFMGQVALDSIIGDTDEATTRNQNITGREDNDRNTDDHEYGGSMLDYGLRTRDVKRNYKRGYSKKDVDHTKERSRTNPLRTFIHRTAQILDISEREVPEILVNPAFKAFRINDLQFEEENRDDSARKKQIEEVFSAANIPIWPLRWFDNAFIFNAEDTAKAQSLEIAAEGKIFIQNPSSYLPVIALEPGDNMDILDMCSAPGGKAALVAELAGLDTSIVANEPKGRRMQKLKEVINLLGVKNIRYSDNDGRHLPNILGREIFDRVLVDAECSTEAGTNFKSRNPLNGWTIDRVQRLSVLQKQLITAAYDLLKPGGILIYSTCTLSPEENEGVVSSLMERRKGVIIQPVKFDAERKIKKIKTWNGVRYPEEVYNGCLRIYPGEYMEGFFLARIRKPTGDASEDAKFVEPVQLDLIANKRK